MEKKNKNKNLKNWLAQLATQTKVVFLVTTLVSRSAAEIFTCTCHFIM